LTLTDCDSSCWDQGCSRAMSC